MVFFPLQSINFWVPHSRNPPSGWGEVPNLWLVKHLKRSQATPHVVFIIWKMQSELRIPHMTCQYGGFNPSLKKWRWVVIRIPKRRTNVWILKQLNSYAACASKACHLDPQNTWPWPSKYSTPKEIGKYSCVNWYVYPLNIYIYIGIHHIYIILTVHLLPNLQFHDRRSISLRFCHPDAGRNCLLHPPCTFAMHPQPQAMITEVVYI